MFVSLSTANRASSPLASKFCRLRLQSHRLVYSCPSGSCPSTSNPRYRAAVSGIWGSFDAPGGLWDRPPWPSLPSRPGGFRPEPLTDPYVSLSTYTARAIARRLPPSTERRAPPGEPVGPNQPRWPTPFAPRPLTETIPIVFTSGFDPVKLGLAANFNRPGGNATGVNLLTTALGPKRLALVRELLPKPGTIAFVVNKNSVSDNE